MAVVRNLMVRIGADYSEMRKGMDGATSRLNRFGRDTRKTTSDVRGKRGLGGISTEFRSLGRTVTDSLSNIRGAKGLGGLTRTLGGLKPALGAATGGLRGLGGAAGGAGLAVGGLIAVLALLTAGLYAASQRAVRFEADLGRLNMQLKGGSRDFMTWSRSLGLARETAAQMGATYGTLLSSFVSGQEDLTNATKQLVQATRVTASATGRQISDVMERMRSGLLGNTEAIEDLGIFVNVSMIESTKAFKRFAGDKSWEQLDFQMQQQIRLAAILEQTYDRYGTELQDNVMTQQELLMEQLKDIQLNLSQAFLPIWDAVLPALTELASSLAYVTEQLARFTYWLRGWDYDERTSGMSDYNDSVSETGDSLDEMGEKAAEARSELAAFDRLNLLGFGTGSGSGGVSSGGSGQFQPPPGGELEDRDVQSWWDTLIRRIKRLRARIKFDPPEPPDGGIGGVASRVLATVNQLSSQLRARFASMWVDLDVQTQAGLTGQLGRWSVYASQLLPQWTGLWGNLRSTSHAESVAIQVGWQMMLDNMLGRLRSAVPLVQADWQKINATIRSNQAPLAEVRLAWDLTLRDMLVRLNVHVPQFEAGWWRTGDAIRSILDPLSSARSAWSSTLQDMYTTIQQRVTGIVSEVQRAITALRNLRQESGQPAVATPAPALSISPTQQPGKTFVESLQDKYAPKQNETLDSALWASKAISDAAKDFATNRPTTTVTPNPTSNRPAWVDETPLLGDLYRVLDWGQEFTEPIAKQALNFVGGGGAAGVAGKGIQWLQRMLKGAIPGFATGAVVSGPTLAMVGEYAGAVNNPEVIAPLSDLESMIDSGEQVRVLRQILTAVERGQQVTVTISEDEVAGAAIRGHNKRARRKGKTELLI